MYNILGDIHGRKVWEDLVFPNRINVFVGDYFDPYTDISFEDMKENFLNIINFAKTNPGTILLLGNHDLHYIYGRESTRYIFEHASEIKKLLLDNMHMFHGIAFAPCDDILITHAGVTKQWLEIAGYTDEPTPLKLVDFINNLFWDGYTEASNGECWWDLSVGRGMYKFKFVDCYWDTYGTDPTQGPTWVRVQTLVVCNALPGKKQIVGHTQIKELIPNLLDDVIDVDCLGQTPASLMIDISDDGIEYKINKKS